MKALLAIDGSRYSADTVEAIGSRPWPAGTTIRVLSAVEVDHVVSGNLEEEHTLESERQETLKNAEELAAWVASSLRARGLAVEVIVLLGDPREVIVNEAKNWAADLIIIGAYGHSGVKKWSLGSVAQSVVSHAPCSVEVVRKKPEIKE
jgi:nucleotide-binding universal stress UspA family protein